MARSGAVSYTHLLGVSAHSVEEAQLAVAHGADYLGVGAAFSTHTKTDVDVLPEGELKKICDAVDAVSYTHLSPAAHWWALRAGSSMSWRSCTEPMPRRLPSSRSSR